MKLLADFAARSFSSLKGLLGAMALVGVLSLTLAAAPLPAMAEEGGSASDENATQTVTVYHFEMVYYDDPTFEDWGVPELTGLRLIGTSTVEGLKPGDVVRAWDQVGTHPGFAFFDGWPRELTVSEDPSENAIQMNYIRQSSEVTVNYYEASLLDNMAAMPLYGNTIVENVGDHMVEFTKMGSEVLDRGLYAEVLTGDELAEETDMVDGLAYAGSYPDDVFVSMDTSKNEINLVYTRPTVRPDDVEVGADVADVPDEVAPPAPDDAPEGPVTGDGHGDAAPDDSAGDKEPAGTPDQRAGRIPTPKLSRVRLTMRPPAPRPRRLPRTACSLFPKRATRTTSPSPSRFCLAPLPPSARRWPFAT